MKERNILMSVVCLHGIMLGAYAEDTSSNSEINYQRCFDCFYTNRNNYIFCGSLSECHPADYGGCPTQASVVTSYEQCAKLIANENCHNQTFTHEWFNREESFDLSLEPGSACTMFIDRTLGGSYGQIAINYTSADLLIFDDLDYAYDSGDQLGLINNDDKYSWTNRTILVANAGYDTINFQAVFTSAIQQYATLTTSLLAASILMTTY